MKPENFVYRINIFLSLAAIALVGYLALIRMQPYSPAPLSEKRFKLAASGLINKEPNALLKGNYAFETKIFKARQLFGQTPDGKPVSQKKAFVLLGISMGNRNLAMIRDTAQNRDYYCIEGDRVGAFKVKQILKDKVILESEGNTLEITQ
jgi:type II secretory pathway component PulC